MGVDSKARRILGGNLNALLDGEIWDCDYEENISGIAAEDGSTDNAVLEVLRWTDFLCAFSAPMKYVPGQTLPSRIEKHLRELVRVLESDTEYYRDSKHEFESLVSSYLKEFLQSHRRDISRWRFTLLDPGELWEWRQWRAYRKDKRKRQGLQS